MMFKVLGETLLELHETQRWVIVTFLKIIDALCVKLIKKLGG